MRHVDDGTIHAWLDGEIVEPGELAWIDEHLRWCAACGTRVAEERAVREQAHALLAIATPGAEPPAFEVLAARAEQERRPADVRPDEGGSLHRNRWFLRAGWAASVLLAATTGWTARELTERRPVERVALAPAGDDRPIVSAPTPTANAASPQDATIAAEPPAAAAARSVAGSATGAAAPGISAARQQQIAGLLEEQARIAAGASAGSLSFAAERRENAPAARAADVAVEALPPPAVAATPPAAAPPAVNPGQAGAGAAALSQPGRAEAARTTPALSQEIFPAGPRERSALARQPVFAAAPRIDWQTVPRTEAAVRSGMPLYGIGGLEPLYTSISSDRRTVRTVYRLDNGATVDLEQGWAPASGTGTSASGPATFTTLQPAATRPFPQSGRVQAAPDPVVTGDLAGSRMWIDTRGEYRVLMRTSSEVADLPALGARLRVD